MWFNFVMKNHGATGAKEFLSPLTDYMRGALGRCGHETTVVMDEIYKSAINVFFEYFPDPVFVDHLLELKRSRSLKVGVIATELMVGGGIPYATHGMLWSGNKETFFRNRVAGFERIAREADFVWSWLERTAHEYRNIGPVSEFFPVGHVGEIPRHLRRAPKDIDVLFFGSRTPHRTAILGAFRAMGMEVLCVGRGFPIGFQTRSHLNCLLDRAKIGLNLNLHAENESDTGADPRFASCMRIIDMLDRELCVVSEEIPLDNPYRDYMVSAVPEDLARRCRELLDSGAWRAEGERFAARYRKEMDVVQICKPVVDRTLESMALPVAA